MPIPAGSSSVSAVPGTTQEWIEKTRALLLSGLQAERNSLAADYSAGSGTLSFSGALGGIVPGVRLSVGQNTFYVRSVNNVGLTASVFGGQEGTTDVSAPAGMLVLVAPRYTDFEILGALNAELADLSGPGNGLFQIKSVDLTYSSSHIGYDLAEVSDLIDIYEVRAQSAGTFRDWPLIPKHGWRLDRSADTATFSSGLALQLFDAGYPGLKVRVLYRAGFAALSDATTDVTTTGLPTSAYDIPPLGAALRLVAPREIKRNQVEAQGDTRRASEVPPGALQGSYRGLAAARASRIQSEAERLTARYPDRKW